MKKVKKGFTLIELIVVIAILGILAAVLIPKFSSFTDKARVNSAQTEAKSCYTAVASYYAEKGSYPTDIKTVDGAPKLEDGATAAIADGAITYTKGTGEKSKIVVKVDATGKVTSATMGGKEFIETKSDGGTPAAGGSDKTE